jgi:hypothetical protein
VVIPDNIRRNSSVDKSYAGKKKGPPEEVGYAWRIWEGIVSAEKR